MLRFGIAHFSYIVLRIFLTVKLVHPSLHNVSCVPRGNPAHQLVHPLNYIKQQGCQPYTQTETDTEIQRQRQKTETEAGTENIT